MPNPTLKTAGNEIREILKKYDLAAMFSLIAEDGTAEVCREVSPTWSCAKYEQHPEGQTLVLQEPKSLAPEGKELPDVHHNPELNEKFRKTVSMMFTFRHIAEVSLTNLDRIISQVSRRYDVRMRIDKET